MENCSDNNESSPPSTTTTVPIRKQHRLVFSQNAKVISYICENEDGALTFHFNELYCRCLADEIVLNHHSFSNLKINWPEIVDNVKQSKENKKLNFQIILSYDFDLQNETQKCYSVQAEGGRMILKSTIMSMHHDNSKHVRENRIAYTEEQMMKIEKFIREISPQGFLSSPTKIAIAKKRKCCNNSSVQKISFY
jgi:hypothetical protein